MVTEAGPHPDLLTVNPRDPAFRSPHVPHAGKLLSRVAEGKTGPPKT